MNEALIELVEQLIEFGYGDSLRLDSVSNRLKNGKSPYPSDQRYVDMLVSKYLYPHIEDKNLRKPIGSLEKKIQNVKKTYGGDAKLLVAENLSDLCQKCSFPVPRMFSFCSKCGAFHDEHNFVDTNKVQQEKEKHAFHRQSSKDTSMKSCIACSSRIFGMHEFCPICGTYQNKNNFKDIPRQQLKRKRYAGMAAVGIISIILGGISFIFLSEYSYLCGSIVGLFAQIINPQAQQGCFVIQILNLIGIILLVTGIILLIVRAVKRRN